MTTHSIPSAFSYKLSKSAFSYKLSKYLLFDGNVRRCGKNWHMFAHQQQQQKRLRPQRQRQGSRTRLHHRMVLSLVAADYIWSLAMPEGLRKRPPPAKIYILMANTIFREHRKTVCTEPIGRNSQLDFERSGSGASMPQRLAPLESCEILDIAGEISIF